MLICHWGNASDKMIYGKESDKWFHARRTADSMLNQTKNLSPFSSHLFRHFYLMKLPCRASSVGESTTEWNLQWNLRSRVQSRASAEICRRLLSQTLIPTPCYIGVPNDIPIWGMEHKPSKEQAVDNQKKNNNTNFEQENTLSSKHITMKFLLFSSKIIFSYDFDIFFLQENL